MSVNLTGIHEFTPLHVSSHFGHLEATKALVERGAAINKTSIYGATPLMDAAHSGKLEIFRYLTKIGADVYIRDAKIYCSALSCRIGKCGYYQIIIGYRNVC